MQEEPKPTEQTVTHRVRFELERCGESYGTHITADLVLTIDDEADWVVTAPNDGHSVSQQTTGRGETVHTAVLDWLKNRTS